MYYFKCYSILLSLICLSLASCNPDVKKCRNMISDTESLSKLPEKIRPQGKPGVDRRDHTDSINDLIINYNHSKKILAVIIEKSPDIKKELDNRNISSVILDMPKVLPYPVVNPIPNNHYKDNSKSTSLHRNQPHYTEINNFHSEEF